MIISAKHKFLFVANPKCGSTSMRIALHPYADLVTMLQRADEQNKMNHHAPLYLIKKAFDKAFAQEAAETNEQPKGLPFEQYYRFGTIRNPFKRFVSWYFFMRPDADFRYRFQPEYDPQTAFKHHFNDFIDHLANNIQKSLPHYEYMYLDWETGEDLAQDVFKLEELNQVFPEKFKEQTGVDIPIVHNLRPKEENGRKGVQFNEDGPNNVKFTGNPYDLYNDNSINYVEQNFATDLSKFNYEFGQ
tara:strand:+ start:21 stop:755 length:735 start_codon:yes stop_codon:yes gene_type:complete